VDGDNAGVVQGTRHSPVGHLRLESPSGAAAVAFEIYDVVIRAI
jgi:hypothetical protein